MFSSPFANPFPESPFLRGNPFRSVQSRIIQPKSDDKRYVNFLAGRDGCGLYRRGFVTQHINMSGIGDSMDTTKMILESSFYGETKCITVQRQASIYQKRFIDFLKSIQSDMGFKLIYEVDDVVFKEEIPDYNVSKESFDDEEVRKNCIDMMNMCDEVTVTCKFMRDLYREKTGKHEITVVPNFMPYWWIGHQYNYKKIIDEHKKHKKRPRIVYSGSGAHFDIKNKVNQQDDFAHVLKFIVDNRKKYRFVFIGSFPPPLQKYIAANEIEFHPWKTLIEYPNFISSLEAQLFLAPLQDNNFNKSKSDIKFVEACQLGIPCFCQDIETYSDTPEFLKFHNGEDLAEKIDGLINWKNRAKFYKLLPDLRSYGETRFLEREENIGAVMESMNTPFYTEERHFLKKWN
jgi:O-antigen biosynthesis protein